MRKLLVLLILCGVAMAADTREGKITADAIVLTGTNSAGVNFSVALHTLPFKVGLIAAKPATCTAGEAYFATDEATGQNVYLCTSLNTWTRMFNAGLTISTGTVDFSAAGHTITAKVGTIAGKPPTCTVGEVYFATDAPAGANWYFCTALNTWTAQSSGGYATVQDEGSGLTQRTIINVVDSLLVASDVSSKTQLAVSTLGHTRQVIFILGSDGGVVLANTDDQASIYVNRLGSGVHVTEVWCQSDAGTPTIQLQKNDGTPTNMLSSDLTCSTSGASTTTFVSGEDAIANTDRIDYLTVAAGGTAKRITVAFKVTVD